MLDELTKHRLIGLVVMVVVGAIAIPVLFSNVQVEYAHQIGEKRAAPAMSFSQRSSQSERFTSRQVASVDLDKLPPPPPVLERRPLKTLRTSETKIYRESKPVLMSQTSTSQVVNSRAEAKAQPIMQTKAPEKQPIPIILVKKNVKRPTAVKAPAPAKPKPVAQAPQPKVQAPKVAAAKPIVNSSVKKAPVVSKQAAIVKHAAAKPASSQSKPAIVISNRAERAPLPTVREATPTAANSRFAVQIGLFAQRQHAKKLTAQLRELGYRVKPELIMNDSGKILTKIKLAPVTNREDAKAQLAAIARQVHLKGIIIKA
jgi:cell division septation protein DedD